MTWACCGKGASSRPTCSSPTAPSLVSRTYSLSAFLKTAVGLFCVKSPKINTNFNHITSDFAVTLYLVLFCQKDEIRNLSCIRPMLSEILTSEVFILGQQWA